MTENLTRLLQIVAKLRDPVDGCPWDSVQTHESISRYTIEEAYEVLDAVDNRNNVELLDELGDLLFQIVLHSRIAEELDNFSFDDVARVVSDKMIRRHPHVFNNSSINSPRSIGELSWESDKAKERAGKIEETGRKHSVLDGITNILPALLLADKIGKRVAAAGFDWPELECVFNKIYEEIEEVRVANSQNNSKALKEEVGDLLFAVASLARHLDIDPETSLLYALKKFERRFRQLEQRFSGDLGENIEESSIVELDQEWNKIKNNEQN